LKQGENMLGTEHYVQIKRNAKDGKCDLIRHLAFIIQFFVYSIIELSNKKSRETISFKVIER